MQYCWESSTSTVISTSISYTTDQQNKKEGITIKADLMFLEIRTNRFNLENWTCSKEVSLPGCTETTDITPSCGFTHLIGLVRNRISIYMRGEKVIIYTHPERSEDILCT